MIPSVRFSSRVWLVIPFIAFGFLIWVNYQRAQRVVNISQLDAEALQLDAGSPTGYAGGKRWLLIPEHNNRSYQWIAETQQMFAKGEWRVRHIDYENAPFGREVHSPSPYRWWLGLIAWCDHTLSGRPMGAAVEHAALLADPLLHLLLLGIATFYVARQLGLVPAAIFSLGLATLFPLAAGFLPGVPDDNSLMQICALGSVLPLLVAMKGRGVTAPTVVHSGADLESSAAAERRRGRAVFLAGVAGGCGLWINVAHEIPVALGIALGGVLSAWLMRPRRNQNSGPTANTVPWRMWALGGATSCLAAYLIEYYPAYLADLRLQTNHPLYGLAWLGIGELLARVQSFLVEKKVAWSARDIVACVAAGVAIAALPATMLLTHSAGFLTPDPTAARLTSLPNGAIARNLAVLIVGDGVSGKVVATCLPLLLLAPAIWLIARRKTGVSARAQLALVLLPAVTALALACSQLRWWTTADGLLLVVVVGVAAVLQEAVDRTALQRWWYGLLGIVCVAGVIQILPAASAAEKLELARLDVEGLIERTLGHWIADHASADGAIILAPPDRTTSLSFYGGLRGLGTPNWENRDGVATAIRIVTATTGDEAFALLQQRGVTHLILPSWDPELDEFTRWSLSRPEDAFLTAVHRWALPPWLRALPYALPAVPGFEGQSVVILEVTDETDRGLAVSRLGEYFVETQQLDLAASAAQTLEQFPADLGALVALATVAEARGDEARHLTVFNSLLSNLATGADRALPWDRRISLSIVLAQGKRYDLAREQLQRCLTELDEPRLKFLTTGTLYRVQVLAKALKLEIPDPRLRALALTLLPSELRQRL